MWSQKTSNLCALFIPLHDLVSAIDGVSASITLSSILKDNSMFGMPVAQTSKVCRHVWISLVPDCSASLCTHAAQLSPDPVHGCNPRMVAFTYSDPVKKEYPRGHM